MTDHTDFSNDQNDASVVHELTRLADKNVPSATLDTKDGRTFVLRRDDFVIEDKTLPNAADVLMPKHVTQSVKLETAASLRDYVNRFKNPDTLLFGHIASNTIVAAIDYHKMPEGAPDDVYASARLLTHNATLQLGFSEEWKRWTGNNEKLMNQEDFAAFLEENQFDVTDPDGASLLELSRDLEATTDRRVRSVVRDGDTIKINFENENNVKTDDNVEMPSAFKIAIPVYFGEPVVEFECLFRRRTSPNLMLGYKIIRMEAKKQKEFQRIVQAVSVDTNILALYGAK